MRVKEPSSRRIKAALSVLAYYAVIYEASDGSRALAYAQAAAQLENEMIRAAQHAAAAAVHCAATERPFTQDDEEALGPVEFSETPNGERARERWARRYDALNGAPESDSDR